MLSFLFLLIVYNVVLLISVLSNKFEKNVYVFLLVAIEYCRCYQLSVIGAISYIQSPHGSRQHCKENIKRL